MLNERDRIQKNEVTTMLGKIATEYNLKLKEVLKLMRSSLTGLKVCSFSISFDFGFQRIIISKFFYYLFF
jgi:hypothetical protein